MRELALALGISDYTTGAIAFVAVAAFIAGLARGFSGFGSALIFVPLASTMIAPSLVAPLLVVVDVVMSAGMIPNAARLADKREVLTMLTGTVVGLPLGTFVLVHASPVSIRWAVAVLVLAMLAVVMSGWRFQGKPRRPLTVAVGAMAGFFSGMSQTGGPPVVLYWLGGSGHHAHMRANLVFYFALSTLLSITAYLTVGMFTKAVFGLALLIGPVYGFGLYIGTRMFGLTDARVFRAVAYGLIAATGLFSLPLFDGILRP
ncbi:MAG: sulfite exporter TauE/SafE family protein [Rhodoplanes sp.]|nr:sulfite exporter TauE/SafE family protein [Rhodoplanes sp.]